MSKQHVLADETRLLVRVCRLYYEEDMMQENIAKEVGVSRPTVSRLLAKGRKLGIVNIQVRDPLDITKQMSEQLKKRFNLKNVVVVPEPLHSAIDVKRNIGREAACLLHSVVKSEDILGVSGGTTIYEAVRHLTAMPLETEGQLPVTHLHNLTIVQLMGGLTIVEDSIHSTEIARHIAQTFGGRVVLVPAPAVLRDHAAIEMLRRDESVGEALSIARSCSIAMVGLGSVKPEGTIFARGYLTKEDYETLKSLGAVGDICLQFFNRDGVPCKDFNDRVLGIDLDSFRRIPTVIGVAGGGEGKSEAILGALRGGYINALVTDEKTAAELLEAVP